jgi:hypothetical protein
MDEALAAYRPESGAGAAGAENRESRNASIPARAGWSESPSGRWKAPERGAPLAKGANRGPPRAALSEAAGGFAGCRLWRMGGPRAGRLAGTDLPDLKVARQPRRPRTGHAPLLHQAMVEKSLEIWPGRSAGSPCMWCTTTERSAKPVLHGHGLFCERRRNESLGRAQRTSGLRKGNTGLMSPVAPFPTDGPAQRSPCELFTTRRTGRIASWQRAVIFDSVW